MKEIKLTQGKVALVDDEDFEYLNQWKWFAHKFGSGIYYAGRNVKVECKNKHLLMHRVILNTPANMFGEHKDHNGLNNQKYNLRNCTQKENRHNSKRRTAKNQRSNFVGVTKNNGYSTYINKKGILRIYYNTPKYIAFIVINKVYKYLGRFDSEIDAAKARDKAAKKYYGEFANLNFK